MFGLVYSDPLVSLLFVIWGWMVRQLASDPGNDEEMAACLWPVRSTNQQHALGVFFMGSLNFDEDSSSIRNSAMSFIPCLLHRRRWRRTGLRQHRSDAKAARCSSSCNFYFLEGCPFMGLDVCSFHILIKSNPFLKKKNQCVKK